MDYVTSLSSFIRYRPDNPAFWDALQTERDALCRQLVKEGDCTELAERLEDCSRHPCGRAACPVCLASADEAMFQSIREMCKEKGDTVFVKDFCYGAPMFAPCGANPFDVCLRYCEQLRENLEESDITVDAYVGRYFFQPSFYEDENFEKLTAM